MILHARGDHAARAFDGVVAVMVDPGFSQYLAPESVRPLLAVERVASVGRVVL